MYRIESKTKTMVIRGNHAASYLWVEPKTPYFRLQDQDVLNPEPLYIQRCQPRDGNAKDLDEFDPDQVISYDSILSDRNWYQCYREMCTDLALRLNSPKAQRRAGALKLIKYMKSAAALTPDLIPNHCIGQHLEEDSDDDDANMNVDQDEALEEARNEESVKTLVDDFDDEKLAVEDICEGTQINGDETETKVATICALLAIVTMLVHTPNIEHQVTASYILKQVYSGPTISREEGQVAANIVNAFRPAVPHKPEKGKAPKLSVFNLAPLATLTKKSHGSHQIVQATLEARSRFQAQDHLDFGCNVPVRNSWRHVHFVRRSKCDDYKC
ncbi:hypothetical protein BJV82DRAFT_20949 [Fennellomyces sp. T-0311]|nr:hypothetical protein BJV82DRAFT_20949 [Fennellomyces sp. T-0311]